MRAEMTASKLIQLKIEKLIKVSYKVIDISIKQLLKQLKFIIALSSDQIRINWNDYLQEIW